MKTSFRFLFTLCLLLSFLSSARALPLKLGDLDEDAVFTANDLARLVGHSAGTAPLAANLVPFADLTQDGVVNDEDQAELVKLILETSTPQNLPLASVREVSPDKGEGDVAVTRETVVHFTAGAECGAGYDAVLC
jgi:hypothetical protein